MILFTSRNCKLWRITSDDLLPHRSPDLGRAGHRLGLAVLHIPDEGKAMTELLSWILVFIVWAIFVAILLRWNYNAHRNK
jgi:hypothetical protein